MQYVLLGLVVAGFVVAGIQAWLRRRGGAVLRREAAG